MPKVNLTEPPPKPAKRVANTNPKPTTPQKTPQQIREEKLRTVANVFIFRLDTNGNRNFLATYPYPLADGIVIEGLIQQLHGAGQYRVEYRNAKGQIVTTDEPLGIEALANVHAPSQPAHSAPMPTHMGLPLTPQYIEAIVKSALQQAKAPESAFEQFLQTAKILKEVNASTPPQKSLLEQVKEVEELKALLGVNKPEPRPTQVVPDAKVEIIKLLLANPDGAENVDASLLRSLLLGETVEKEPSFWDMAKEALAGVMPIVLPAIANYLAPATATAQAGTMPPTANPQTAPAQTPPAQTAPPTVAPYQRIIARILQAIEQGIQPDFIADEIQQMADQDATLAPMIESLLSVEPSQLLQGLGQLSPEAARACQLPHALQWLTDLQSQFIEEDEAAETSGAAQATTAERGIPGQGATPKNAKAGV